MPKTKLFHPKNFPPISTLFKIKTHFEKRKREREEYQIELNSSHQHHFPSVQKHTYTFAETNSYYIKVPNYDPTKGLVKRLNNGVKMVLKKGISKSIVKSILYTVIHNLVRILHFIKRISLILLGMLTAGYDTANKNLSRFIDHLCTSNIKLA